MARRLRATRPDHLRRRILEEEGLTLAPREVQQLFWARFNRARRTTWRNILAAGDVADRLLKRLTPLEGIAAAWQAIAPPVLSGTSRVLSLENGVLTIEVDGNASRFAVRRLFGAQLTARLNQHLGENRIARIDCRIGGRGRA